MVDNNALTLNGRIIMDGTRRVYVVIRNGPPKGSLQPLGVYTHLFGNPEACCICTTKERARDKAAGLARDYVAEMVKDGTLDNCMEVNITEYGSRTAAGTPGFELDHGCECGDRSVYGHDDGCDGENICNFTVSEVDCKEGLTLPLPTATV
jgi:hypothetical protein